MDDIKVFAKNKKELVTLIKRNKNIQPEYRNGKWHCKKKVSSLHLLGLNNSRIHQLHLCREVRTPNACPGYDTKQSDGVTPVMLELLGVQSTPSLLLLPGPLWPRLVAPDRVLFMG